jgi:hypothetical protein
VRQLQPTHFRAGFLEVREQNIEELLDAEVGRDSFSENIGNVGLSPRHKFSTLCEYHN